MPTWTIESEHKLLLTIIKLLNISQMPKWDEVAKEMNTLGLSFTSEGCRQHFQKIRKTSNTGTTKKSAAASPAKPSGVSKKTASPAKRKLGQLNERDVDDEEVIFMPSKSSKTKGVGTPSKATSASLNGRIKSEKGYEQTGHVSKTGAPDDNGVIHIDDDESIYDGE
ncbi:hypothetical protein ABW19_dt0204934 [Dactylella cylindrospora]|nr:hypothetical protein ABW19_dt0204934 [Dactylella cylindrospora]